MRLLRAKQGRKTLNYYRISFGIAPPYSVLLDGNFIHAATKHHIDLHARIGKQLSGEAYVLLVPSCVVEELESIGEPVAAALEFARNQCDLLEAPKHDASQTCADVIKALVGAANPRQFFVATQEDELRNHLRGIPAVPLMHIQRTVLLMETPSSSSRHRSFKAEAKKQSSVSAVERETIDLARRIRRGEIAKKRRRDGEKGVAQRVTVGSSERRKKTVAKGPNPLSVKKKKPKNNASGSNSKSAQQEEGGEEEGGLPAGVTAKYVTARNVLDLLRADSSWPPRLLK